MASSLYTTAFSAAGQVGTYSVCGGKGAGKHSVENRPSSLERLHIRCLHSKVSMFIFLIISLTVLSGSSTAGSRSER